MLAYFIKIVTNAFRMPTIQDNLEAFIMVNQPQTVDEVDRLEREFYRRKTAITAFPFFHE
jgi:hypothetical protein